MYIYISGLGLYLNILCTHFKYLKSHQNISKFKIVLTCITAH